MFLINNRELCTYDSSIEVVSVITVFEIDPNDKDNYTADHKIGEKIKL